MYRVDLGVAASTIWKIEDEAGSYAGSSSSGLSTTPGSVEGKLAETRTFQRAELERGLGRRQD